MDRPRRPGLLVRLTAAAALALAGAPGSASAQIVLLVDDGTRATLSGYLRSLTGLHDRGFELPGSDRRSGFHGEVVRLKWRLETGRFVLDVHDRLQARVTSGEGQGPVLGFGVSAVPGRSVDLSTDLIAQPGLRVFHDIDRLSLGIRTDAVDLTLGRQPITWGTSTLFPVADLWTAFSPFELDTEEKPGIDAARALFYPVAGIEVDVVVADRGAIEHLSAGARATWGLPSADVWLGGGRFWDRGMAMGGVVLLFDETKARAEAVFPFDGLPRVTLGFDWIRGRLALSGEAHYNGTGAADADAYIAQAAEPELTRGESYFLGRYYLGAAGSWAPDEAGRLRLALSTLVNVGDPSAALTPILDYDLGPATSLSLGGLVSFGQTPIATPPPSLRSEFGAYGDLVFTRVSVYF